MTEQLKQHRDLDYEVMIHKDQARKAMRWCEEQYGPRWEAIGNRTGIWTAFWSGRYNRDHYRFDFVYKRDMMWFILHWGVS